LCVIQSYVSSIMNLSRTCLILLALLLSVVGAFAVESQELHKVTLANGDPGGFIQKIMTNDMRVAVLPDAV
jgi:hypothetical protein